VQRIIDNRYFILIDLWLIMYKSIKKTASALILVKHKYQMMIWLWGTSPPEGLLTFVSAEIIPKLAGSAAILVTHKLPIS
tara:strand:- start:905 stop:1144 length:240 start_codon:yes stop_codon:yes gene_type:complete